VAVISGKERPVDRKQMATVAPQGVVLVFPLVSSECMVTPLFPPPLWG
jgi:hypothetical protein